MGEILVGRKDRRAFRRLVNILCGFFVVVKFADERQGPGWRGRVKSKILGPARHLFTQAAALAGRGQPWLGRARLATGGRAGLVPQRFLKQHPLLVEILADSAKLGGALCIFFATRRLNPLQRRLMKQAPAG